MSAAYTTKELCQANRGGSLTREDFLKSNPKGNRHQN
jgi:hypothetical protein